MTEGKYIIFADGTAKVFPEALDHYLQAEGKAAISAGFFQVVRSKVVCYGDSSSLRLQGRAIDAEIIAPLLANK